MNKTQRKNIERLFDRLSEINEELEYIKNEEEEKMDNLPENLQNSVKYEEFETAVEALDDALNSITEACDKLEELFNNA